MYLLCAVGCKLQIYEDLNFHSLLFCPLLLLLFVKAYALVFKDQLWKVQWISV